VTTAKIAVDFADQISWMLNLGSIHCYNCGWHIAEASQLKITVWDKPIFHYGDYGINAMTLQEFVDCLRLDRPPPEDLPKALKQYQKSMDIEVLRVLSKMKVNFANTYYNVSALGTELLKDEFVTMQMMTSQRMSDEYMSELELQEILLTHEVCTIFGGTIIAHPSTLNVHHALYDMMDCVSDSTWFSRSGVLIKNDVKNLDGIEVMGCPHRAVIYQYNQILVTCT